MLSVVLFGVFVEIAHVCYLQLVLLLIQYSRNGSSLGRAGGRLRRYPGGTENASIFATVRGSMPNRRAASRRLIPSTYTARRTCPYSSTRFIPPPTSAAPRQMGYCCRIFTPAQPVYPAASVRDFLSGAYTFSEAREQSPRSTLSV